MWSIRRCEVPPGFRFLSCGWHLLEPVSVVGFLAFSGGDQTNATTYVAAVLLLVTHQFLPGCQHFSSCPIASPQQSLAGTSFGMHEVPFVSQPSAL